MSPLHAVIAVKDLTRAKSRLATDFAPPDRRRLVLAMLCDTLTAAGQVDEIASVTVVTPDDAVMHAAAAAGAAVLAEPVADSSDFDADQRLNAAFRLAAATVRAERGPVDLLALQADLPALSATELGAAARAARRFTRSFVVDHRRTGTAALLVRDRNTALTPTFGADSARRHAATGAALLEGDWPGLRLDVDTLDDLELAAAIGLGNATRAALAEIGWPNRCPG
ncbi:2-phospho-L-lactate guanylyltransferase [Antrihabitans sp. YC2-6]|uniref:2-phospho-L-lactate guanylyltransferase n=1 Tax=Antrihabitans sp. YC2-6 TaxID=2799498 RepID=UPI0018F6CDF6|nr:2-phospho-L-lactate guanylyltransferase [Antrihabitans sp. YC2-6]MBJ8343401.1 2-phospho-L-lactate guanylyltransferase [Antrihabitans sp. YC2-6]